jgi:hypothetical protein
LAAKSGHSCIPFSRLPNQTIILESPKAELTEASVDWRQLYTAAILNTDPTCFEVVLDEVARAIDVRLMR